MTLLVAYASLYGSTQEMAQTLTTILREAGYPTQLSPIEDVTALESYAAVILGSPIHCGLWAKPMQQFFYQKRQELQKRPLYTWITCMRVLENGGYDHAQKYYITSDIRKLATIRSIEVFAGRILPSKLSWEDYTDLHQRYDGNQEIVYQQGDHREWARFRAWGEFILKDLKTQAILPTQNH